ncbi:MAG: PulJ/GspJ family protein [Gemmatimonadaceae bacterium]
MRVRTVPGVTLVELQVAVVVGGILVAAAYTSLLSVRRVVDEALRRGEAYRAGADAIGVLEAIGEQLRYPVVVGDTALHGELRIGAGIVCRQTPATLTLAPAYTGSSEALTFLAETPIVGDRLEAFGGEATGEREWRTYRVTAVALMTAHEGCGSDAAAVAVVDRGRQVLRLSVDPPPGAIPAGAPVELYRTVRLVLYHAGAQGWTVGFRTCPALRCGASQPIVGPVRSPSDDGLRFRIDPTAPIVRTEVRVPGSEHRFEGVLRAYAFGR